MRTDLSKAGFGAGPLRGPNLEGPYLASLLAQEAHSEDMGWYRAASGLRLGVGVGSGKGRLQAA